MGEPKRHESTTITPNCPVCGEVAVEDKGGMTTFLGGISFVGDDGMVHNHDPNTHTGHWVCPNGHEWKEEVGFQCGCGWKGKPWTHSVKILKK